MLSRYPVPAEAARLLYEYQREHRTSLSVWLARQVRETCIDLGPCNQRICLKLPEYPSLFALHAPVLSSPRSVGCTSLWYRLPFSAWHKHFTPTRVSAIRPQCNEGSENYTSSTRVGARNSCVDSLQNSGRSSAHPRSTRSV